MAVQILLGLLLLLLIVAIAFVLLVYVPLLPLLSQVWLVEAFGDPDAGVVLPAVTLVGAWAVVGYAYAAGGRRPSAEAAARLALGVALLVGGAWAFGGVWEVLELKQRYHASADPLFSTSCADVATTCLTHDDRSPYPDQLLPAIGAEILWYGGLAVLARELGVDD